MLPLITLGKTQDEEAVKLGPSALLMVQSFVKMEEFGFFRKPGQ